MILDNVDDIATIYPESWMFRLVHPNTPQEGISSYALWVSQISSVRNGEQPQWWVEEEGYDLLSDTELAILLENLGEIEYSTFVSRSWRQEGVVNLLEHPQISAHLQLHLAMGGYNKTRVARWMAHYNGGVIMAAAAEFIKKTGERDEGLFLNRVASLCLWDWRGKRGSEGYTARCFVESLNPAIVTPSFLSKLANVHPQKEWVEYAGKALAVHARRIYGFDESIPDEWVLKAIEE